MSVEMGQYVGGRALLETAPTVVNTCMRGADVAQGTCSVDGCDKPFFARGWCSMHYGRWRSTGRLSRSRPRSPAEALEMRTRRLDNGCVVWTGGKDNHGYGLIFQGRGKSRRAHRAAYELARGPIPPGLELDHLCHTRDLTCTEWEACPHHACVNPDHLEPVTHAENVRRGRSGPKPRETCRAGVHPLTPDNVYVKPNGDRSCRTCQSATRAAYRAANLAAVRERDRDAKRVKRAVAAESALAEFEPIVDPVYVRRPAA